MADVTMLPDAPSAANWAASLHRSAAEIRSGSASPLTSSSPGLVDQLRVAVAAREITDSYQVARLLADQNEYPHSVDPAVINHCLVHAMAKDFLTLVAALPLTGPLTLTHLAAGLQDALPTSRNPRALSNRYIGQPPGPNPQTCLTFTRCVVQQLLFTSTAPEVERTLLALAAPRLAAVLDRE